MKKNYLLFLLSLLTFTSCKEKVVNASDPYSFETSVNDIENTLNTLEQIKFREALYIIKAYGTSSTKEMKKMEELRKLVNGKNAQDIFSLANSIAGQQNVDWSSTGLPSLDDMNIFDKQKAKEYDPNDIKASGVSIKTISMESMDSDKPIGVIIQPILVDGSNNPIKFSGATLLTTMTVSSGGNIVKSAKNFMQNNDFSGFRIYFSHLPYDKVVNDKVDVKVEVEVLDKKYQFTKTNIPVHYIEREKLVQDQGVNINDSINEMVITYDNDNFDFNQPEDNSETTVETPVKEKRPQASNTVRQFLSKINSKDLKSAYNLANNPSWGSYNQFSNSSTGFGAVKNVQIKNVVNSKQDDNNATVKATYSVTDKNGNTTNVNANYTLKFENGNWKIVNYQVQ